MTVTGSVGGGVFENGFSAHGVTDVWASFARDAAPSALLVQGRTTLALLGAAVDGGLVPDFLGSGLGVRAVVGRGGAVGAFQSFPRRAGVKPPSRRLVLPEHFHLVRERHKGVLRSGPLQSLL